MLKETQELPSVSGGISLLKYIFYLSFSIWPLKSRDGRFKALPVKIEYTQYCVQWIQMNTWTQTVLFSHDHNISNKTNNIYEDHIDFCHITPKSWDNLPSLEELLALPQTPSSRQWSFKMILGDKLARTVFQSEKKQVAEVKTYYCPSARS